MAGQANRIRQSRWTQHARADRAEGNRTAHPHAPFLAIVGASLPWLVYDALIKNPDDFWAWKGAIVLATVALGVVLVGVSWHFSLGLSNGNR